MSKAHKRGNVWLAVSGLVINNKGEWLVVKKRYGGLKGKWSLPAGFVERDETADQAVVREVKEETGLDCEVQGLLGLRTGVIKEEISDNMLVFLLKPLGEQVVIHQERELYEATFLSSEALLKEEDASILLHYLITLDRKEVKSGNRLLNPGDIFGYTAYHLFF